MSSVPRLNYFVENETAESATKSFAIILQKAFKQYRKLWDKYLDLIRKYEVDSPTCEKIQKTWERENISNSGEVMLENIDFLNKAVSPMQSWERKEDKCHAEQNKNIIADILKVCKLDFDSDIDDTFVENNVDNIDDTIYQSQSPHKELKNIILPESPIFMRKDKQVVSTISKSETSTNNDNKTSPPTSKTDHIVGFNKQHDASSETHIKNISFDSMSPVAICNTPMAKNEYHMRNRKKLVKKKVVCEYKKQLKDNSGSLNKKQQMGETKIPLQALENFISPSKVNLYHNENKTRSSSFAEFNCSRVSSGSKKLRQKTLSFCTNRNEVDNAIIKSTDKNVPTIKYKKFLFNSKCCTESIVSPNKAISDKTIDTICIGNANDQNKIIREDIIENSPNAIYVQPQNNHPVTSKRKFSESEKIDLSELSMNTNQLDSAFISPYNSPIKTQSKVKSQTCLTKKRNITFDDSPIGFTSETVVDDAKEMCVKMSKDTEWEWEPAKKNNFDESSSIEKQESTLLDVFQSGNEDETYFEGYIQEEKKMNVNKKSPIYKDNCTPPAPEFLTNTHYELKNSEKNNTKCTITLSRKGDGIKTKEGWSCWECAEYYKNKPGLSEKNVQMWKNQCSRHRNIYYARQATPPGFWDPLLPATASDSIQEN